MKVELAFIMASCLKRGGEKEKDDEISIQPESPQLVKEELGNLCSLEYVYDLCNRVYVHRHRHRHTHTHTHICDWI